MPVRPYKGRDAYGMPSYGPAHNVMCRVEFRRANVINSTGETVTSEVKLYSAQSIAVGGLVAINGVEWPVISCGPATGLDGAIDHYEARA